MKVWSAPARGRLIVSAVLGGYFIALFAAGGHDAWVHFQVPALRPTFLDARTITTGWDCTRKGVDVLPLNPCDPYRRPANYPRLWFLPSHLGLGEGATVALGLLTAAAFLVAVLLVMGRVRRLGDALVWALALTSPAVMLGIERGNIDLLVFALLVLALILLWRRRPLVQDVAHGLFLLAAMLKLFPVFAFGVLLRQRRTGAVVRTAVVVLAFGAYAVATLADIRTIRRVVPQLISYSYGLTVGSQVARRALANLSPAFRSVTHGSAGWVVTWLMVVAAISVGVAVACHWRPAVTEGRALDAFWAGAAIYVGTYVAERNFDYRLCFLLLTLPQLLRWSRDSWLARITLGAVILTLWLSEPLTNWNANYSFEELLNWLLFASFAGMLLATRPRLFQRPSDSATNDPTSASANRS